MKRSFTKKPITASTEEESKSRVIAIQLDVEVPEDVDADDVINFFESAVSSTSVQEFHIAGSEFVEDLTDIYEKQYPDLLVYRD